MSWNKYYDMLKDYYSKTNTCNVFSCFENEYPGLYDWVCEQRNLFANGKLDKNNKELLDKLNFEFKILNMRQTSLPEQIIFYYIKKYFPSAKNRFKDLGFELDIYFEHCGKKIAIEYDGYPWHTDVEKDILKFYKSKNENIFLINIRDEKCGSMNISDPMHFEIISESKDIARGHFSHFEAVLNSLFVFISELLDVDIDFDINIYRDLFDIIKNFKNSEFETWMKNYIKLKEIYKKNGNNKLKKEDGESIKWWCFYQRFAYKNSFLIKQKVLLLENIGFNFVTKNNWYDSFNLANEYYIKNGTINVNKFELYGSFKIGRWIDSQRTAYKNNKLEETQISLLEGIGIIWNMEENQWLTQYHLLTEYYKKNGHINLKVFEKYKGSNLGKFLSHQREAFNAGTMSSERLEMLNMIGFNKNIEVSKSVNHINDDLWLMKYNILKNYYNENGNINIPFDYILYDVKIGKFIADQRYLYRTGNLLNERYLLLKEIGFDENLKNTTSKY